MVASHTACMSQYMAIASRLLVALYISCYTVSWTGHEKTKETR